MVEAIVSWTEIHITTSAEHAQTLGDALSEEGAHAVSFQDAGDQPIYEPSPDKLELWQNTVVIGLFDAAHSLASLIPAMETQQAQGLIKHFHVKHLEDQDWQRVCLDYFKAMSFGKRLWICPSWHIPPDSTAVNVNLDPGLAFGTGSHPTTALCLAWLDQYISDRDKLVIDYGCGSGILGIAALKLGAQSVIAIDNDPQALEATLANGERNNLFPPQLVTQLPFLIEKNLQADLIIANILAQPLLELAPYLSSLVKIGGKIILSGILENQVEKVKSAYLTWFNMHQCGLKEGWALLEGNKL